METVHRKRPETAPGCGSGLAGYPRHGRLKWIEIAAIRRAAQAAFALDLI
jgi:hypothetical protein